MSVLGCSIMISEVHPQVLSNVHNVSVPYHILLPLHFQIISLNLECELPIVCLNTKHQAQLKIISNWLTRDLSYRYIV